MGWSQQEKNKCNTFTFDLQGAGIGPKVIKSLFSTLYMDYIIDGSSRTIDAFLNSGRLLMLENLIKGNNLMAIVRELYPYMGDEVIKLIAENNMSEDGRGVGECEYALVLFSKTGKKINNGEGEGDIIIDGFRIEIKCGGGHMCGQGNTIGDINAYHYKGIQALKNAGLSDCEAEWTGAIVVGRMIKEIWNRNPAALRTIILSKCYGLYGMAPEAEHITNILVEKLQKILTPKVIGTYKSNRNGHYNGESKYKIPTDTEVGKTYIHYFGIWQAYMYTKISGVSYLIFFNKKNYDYKVYTNDGDFEKFLLNMTDDVKCSLGPKLHDPMCKATVVELK